MAIFQNFYGVIIHWQKIWQREPAIVPKVIFHRCHKHKCNYNSDNLSEKTLSWILNIFTDKYSEFYLS